MLKLKLDLELCVLFYFFAHKLSRVSKRLERIVFAALRALKLQTNSRAISHYLLLLPAAGNTFAYIFLPTGAGAGFAILISRERADYK